MTDMETRLFQRFRWLRDLHARLPWGFEHGPGWERILTDFFAAVEEQIPGGQGFGLRQIKEKMGGLRIYHDPPADLPEAGQRAIQRAYALAEARSYHTCERCGSPGILRVAGGYYFVACDAHSKPNGRESRVLPDYSGFRTTSIRDDRGWSLYDPEIDGFVDSDLPVETRYETAVRDLFRDRKND